MSGESSPTAEAGAASPTSYQAWRKANTDGVATADLDSLLHQIERFKISALKNQYSERLSPKKRSLRETKTKPFGLSTYRRAVTSQQAYVEGGMSSSQVADEIHSPEAFGTNKFLTKEGAARELLHTKNLDAAERLSTLSHLLRDTDRALAAATIENKRFEKIIVQERAEAEQSRKQAEAQINRLKDHLVTSGAEIKEDGNPSNGRHRAQKHMTPEMRQKRLLLELQERCADAAVEKLNLESNLDYKRQQCDKLQKQVNQFREALSNQQLDEGANELNLMEENRRLQERIKTITADKRQLQERLAIALRIAKRNEVIHGGASPSSPKRSPMKSPRRGPNSPRKSTRLVSSPKQRRQPLRRAGTPTSSKKQPQTPTKKSSEQSTDDKSEDKSEHKSEDKAETKAEAKDGDANESKVELSKKAEKSTPKDDESEESDSDSDSSGSSADSSQEDSSSSDEDDEKTQKSEPSASSSEPDLCGFVQLDGAKVWAQIQNGALSWGPSKAQVDKNSFALSSVGRVRAAGGRLIVKLDKGIKVFEMADTDKWVQTIEKLRA